MLRQLTGFGPALDEELARFPARFAASAQRAMTELGEAGRLRAGAEEPVLAPPKTFAETLAAALVLEQRDPRAGLRENLVAHYFELMPRARVEQLAVADEPHATIFHRPIDWARTPRLGAMLDKLFVVAKASGVDTVRALGADSAARLLAERKTIGELYAPTYYGASMPLLYYTPSDLRRVRTALEAGGRVEEVVDRHLAASLAHELAHGRRDRDALWPPYLDECVAGWLGVRAMTEFAFPAEGESNAIQATPWLSQVGQALAAVFGAEKIVAAHLGGIAWNQALPEALVAHCARLGWAEHVAHRRLHFLSSHLRPEPWIKLFHLAASGAELSQLGLDDIDNIPWADIETRASPMDGNILHDGLRAMCLRGFLDRGTPRVERRVPRGTITLELDSCRFVAPAAEDSIDSTPPRYLFPPALAAALRAKGHARIAIELTEWSGIAGAVEALARGESSGRGPGWSIGA